MKVKVNYTGLLVRLEEQTGKTYSDRYIAETSSVRRKTLIDMRYNRLKNVSLVTLDKLSDFFVSHGLEVEPSDLLTYA